MPQTSRKIDRVTIPLPRELNLQLDAEVLSRRARLGRRVTRAEVVIQVLGDALAGHVGRVPTALVART
jgi:hypothetical protein